jgi:hypothetical protein
LQRNFSFLGKTSRIISTSKLPCKSRQRLEIYLKIHLCQASLYSHSAIPEQIFLWVILNKSPSHKSSQNLVLGILTQPLIYLYYWSVLSSSRQIYDFWKLRH